jgi:pilus assembly protein CpaB
MNRLGITFIFIALIISLLVTGLVYKYEKQKHRKEVEEVSRIQVLVATKPLSRGETVDSSDVRWQVWPKAAVSPQFLIHGSRKIEDITGSLVRVPIDAGQPFTDALIVSKSHMSPLASIIRPDMRAFTIEMDKGNAVAGLLLPGDIVDVVVTYATMNSTTRDRAFVGGTILKNILVVGVDQDISSSGSGGGSSSKSNNTTKSITLEVTPKQAEFLAVGKSMGTLYLSLANGVGESQESKKQTVTYQDDLMGNSDPDAGGGQISQIHGAKEGQADAT